MKTIISLKYFDDGHTGPKLVINLLLVALFFIPLIVKGAALWGIGEIQHPVVDAFNEVQSEKTATDETKLISVRVACSATEGGKITISIPPREVRVDKITARIPGAEKQIKCRSMPMWQLLLGAGGPYGIWMPILTGVLVAYQIARFLMTNQISLIRDAEERSGISPSKHGWFAYPMLYRMHQVLSPMFWVVIAAVALRAVEFLSSEVILRLST